MSHELLSYFGVKVSSLVAGFFGGVLSLGFLKALGKLQMALAVLTGTVTAGYLNPLVAPILAGWASSFATPGAVESASAFLLGLCAMNILSGVMKLSEIFRKDPLSMLGKGKGEQP